MSPPEIQNRTSYSPFMIAAPIRNMVLHNGKRVNMQKDIMILNTHATNNRTSKYKIHKAKADGTAKRNRQDIIIVGEFITSLSIIDTSNR